MQKKFETLNELKERRNNETLPSGLNKFFLQDRFICASFNQQQETRLVFCLILAQDLSFNKDDLFHF